MFFFFKQVQKKKKEIENILEEFHITVNKEENDEKIINEQMTKNRDNIENAIKDFNILKVSIYLKNFKY